MKTMKFLLVFFLNLLWIGNVMAIEEPKFEVLLTDGSFEIRQYAPYLTAETLVMGDMDEASGKGFRLIADYIFGNNQAISSTASEKISMTAPVTIEPQMDAGSMETSKQWLVKFIMPSQYTLATIPKPKNSAVNLREVPSKRYAVLKYSGFNFQSKVQSKTETAEETKPAANGDKLIAELDDLLDEIDDVLETNAEDFVKNYVQKGGQ